MLPIKTPLTIVFITIKYYHYSNMFRLHRLRILQAVFTNNIKRNRRKLRALH